MFLLKKQVIRQRIVHSGMLQVSMTWCSLCVRFSTYILIARMLGTQGFGILLLTQTLAALLLSVIGIGMTPLANCTLAQIGQAQTTRSIAGIFSLLRIQQCRRILLYCCTYIPLAFGLTLCFKNTLPLILLLLAGLATLPLFLGSIVSTTLQGLRRYDLLAGMRFLYILLYLCFVLLSIPIHSDMLSYVLLLAPAFANMVTLTLALVYLARLLPLAKAIEPGPLLRERVEREGQGLPWRLLLLDSIIWRELFFLLLLLLYRHTPAALSSYALSVMLCTGLMKAIPTLFVTYLVPLLTRHVLIRLYNPYDAFVYTSCIIAGIAIVLCTLLALCCPVLIAAGLGVAYLPIVTPLRILLITVIFGSTTTVGMTYLIQHTHKREQFWLGGGTIVLHVVLGIPCIALWGVIGAAIASTLTHTSVGIGTFLLCRHKFMQAS